MFRVIYLVLLATVLPATVNAEDISLTIENITEPQGILLWSVFDSKEGFDKDLDPVVSGRSRVASDSIKVTLHNLPMGVYAVKLFHDANSNGELDTNLLGLPQEGYGFSNNAGAFGPASFSDAKVSVTDDIEIKINLR